MSEGKHRNTERRLFSEVLTDLGVGRVEFALTDKLEQVVKGVIETGKKGQIVFTLDIGGEGEGQVIVKPKIKATIPEPGLGSNIFIVDENHELHREDPRQERLPFAATFVGDVPDSRVTSLHGDQKEPRPHRID